jgi:hypothetical protein
MVKGLKRIGNHCAPDEELGQRTREREEGGRTLDFSQCQCFVINSVVNNIC